MCRQRGGTAPCHPSGATPGSEAAFMIEEALPEFAVQRKSTEKLSLKSAFSDRALLSILIDSLLSFPHCRQENSVAG